jgi:hypothetical protein
MSQYSILHWLTADVIRFILLGSEMAGSTKKNQRGSQNCERKIGPEGSMMLKRLAWSLTEKREMHISVVTPVVATTSGVKSACSTLRMRSKYSCFFLFSSPLRHCILIPYFKSTDFRTFLVRSQTHLSNNSGTSMIHVVFVLPKLNQAYFIHLLK